MTFLFVEPTSAPRSRNLEIARFAMRSKMCRSRENECGLDLLQRQAVFRGELPDIRRLQISACGSSIAKRGLNLASNALATGKSTIITRHGKPQDSTIEPNAGGAPVPMDPSTPHCPCRQWRSSRASCSAGPRGTASSRPRIAMPIARCSLAASSCPRD